METTPVYHETTLYPLILLPQTANPIANPNATLATEEFFSVNADAIGTPRTPSGTAVSATSTLDSSTAREEKVEGKEEKATEEGMETEEEEEEEEEPLYKELDAETIKWIEVMENGFKNKVKHYSASYSYNQEWMLGANAPHVQSLPLVQQQATFPTGGIPFVGEASLGRARGEVVGGLL